MQIGNDKEARSHAAVSEQTICQHSLCTENSLAADNADLSNTSASFSCEAAATKPAARNVRLVWAVLGAKVCGCLLADGRELHNVDPCLHVSSAACMYLACMLLARRMRRETSWLNGARKKCVIQQACVIDVMPAAPGNPLAPLAPKGPPRRSHPFFPFVQG
jgi:hypothetical protein